MLVLAVFFGIALVVGLIVTLGVYAIAPESEHW